MQIGIEPVWQLTIYSIDMMQKMIKDIASKNISVILDISNLMHSEIFDKQDYVINSAFEKFGDRISTIHLKDYYHYFEQRACLLSRWRHERSEFFLYKLPLNFYMD